MTLTKENMKTVPEGIGCDIGVLVHDICQMDETQLERYLISSFTGVIDFDFLPPEFWHGFSLISSDRILSAGQYFGGQLYHRITAEAISPRPDATLYQEGKNRFSKILKKLMEECINNQGIYREILARTLVDVAWSIRFNEMKAQSYPIDNREIHGLGLKLNDQFKCTRDYRPTY